MSVLIIENIQCELTRLVGLAELIGAKDAVTALLKAKMEIAKGGEQ